MVNSLVYLILIIGLIGFPNVYAQTIQVNETEPCFLNYTAGARIFQQCGFTDDWLEASLIGFEWVTGGYFSFIFLGVIVMATYIKYHKVLYPLIIGIFFLPVAWTLIPTEFWVYLILLVGASLIFTIWKIVKNQTTEF